MAKRSVDQMIGFVGGIIGIILGVILILGVEILGGGSPRTGDSILLFSLIGILGAYLLSSRKKDGSMMLIVIGIAGIIAFASTSASGIIPLIAFVLLLVSGVIARM